LSNINHEIIALNGFLDTLENGEIFEELDWDLALDWPKFSGGRVLLLRLLTSEHKSAFQLANYVLSESIWISKSFMNDVVVPLRLMGRDGQLCFCSIVFLRSIWNPSYSDLLVSSLHSDILFVRERAIRILISNATSAFEDISGFLISKGYCPDLEMGPEYAYKKLNRMRAEKTDVEKICSDLLLEKPVLIRVVRALHIADLLRKDSVNNVRKQVPEEDSYIFDNLGVVTLTA
jgi:hypothetical protein